MNLFCFGYGYTAQHMAPLVIGSSGTITGTARRPADHDACFAWHGHDLSPAGRQALAQADGVLISVPPDDDGCPVMRVIDQLLPAEKNPPWVCYLSTTGVYGDRHGEWVDEDTSVRPLTARSQQRVLAERQWQDWATRHNTPLQICRLSGIYGPGRSPFDRIARGDGAIIHAPGHVFNRIHVMDIARAIMAGYTQRVDGIYNLSDDLPTPQEDVMRFAYDLLGQTPPNAVPLAQADLSPMAREFYSECKRVCNEKLKRDLGLQLMYPTYAEGLSAIHRDSMTQPSA